MNIFGVVTTAVAKIVEIIAKKKQARRENTTNQFGRRKKIMGVAFEIAIAAISLCAAIVKLAKK